TLFPYTTLFRSIIPLSTNSIREFFTKDSFLAFDSLGVFSLSFDIYVKPTSDNITNTRNALVNNFNYASCLLMDVPKLILSFASFNKGIKAIKDLKDLQIIDYFGVLVDY